MHAHARLDLGAHRLGPRLRAKMPMRSELVLGSTP